MLLLWTPRLWACASCAEDIEELVGVSPEGVVVIAANHSTGESDAREIWSVRLEGKAGLICRMEVFEQEQEIRRVEGPEPARCENLPGTGRKQVVERLRKKLRLAAFAPAAPPPVELPLVEEADGYNPGHEPQEVLLNGAPIAATAVGSRRWFVTAYRHPRWDGVVLRLITLLPSEGQRTGSTSGCTDYADEYHLIPRAKLRQAAAASR